MPDETDFTPSHMLCVKCGKLMRLVAIEPSEAVPGADDITYRCAFCDHEEKRIQRPRVDRKGKFTRVLSVALEFMRVLAIVLLTCGLFLIGVAIIFGALPWQ